MTVAVRFAPSPTGRLHVGNARVALLNWLFARAEGGRFILRIDDTDEERSETVYEEAIREDLAWLGLAWDEEARQSSRLDRYEAAAETLRAAGRLYPCYETAEELALKRRILRERGLPPIYDRAALALGEADRARLEAEGRRSHWRFRLDHEAIAWTDVIHGDWRFEGENLSDPVLVREDGRPLFALSSAVDDIDMGISHVIRGEDHVSTTAAQIQLFRALGAEPPIFAHLPLLTDAGGQGLSKRLGSLSLADLRKQGIEPMAINSYLALLGTPDPIRAVPALGELVADFDLARYGRAAPKFDPAELQHLNARLLHDLPFEAIAGRLAAMGLDGADAAFWEAVRPNLDRLEDAKVWHRVCHGEIDPAIDEADFTRAAAALLPLEPWDEETWGVWTVAVKADTGRKGKALFLPLRRALTGLDHGPELKLLLPLIGRARAEARLAGRAA
ncbi:MAG: glutamate--tRNA ligase [Rhodospirillaceae bacterium]|jgi:glutamyl-tRNA synthetase|nr:glutamate--tRNA ligase [Rhodospirillaceae bacterium]MBT6118683.1 glutamate--tRNA ligase [Rhodospirillaceae bacterium]